MYLQENGPVSTRATFHATLNELRGIVEKLRAMLDASEEHKEACKEQSLVVFRRAPNCKDTLVRAKLPRSQIEGVRNCFKCAEVRCKV